MNSERSRRREHSVRQISNQMKDENVRSCQSSILSKEGSCYCSSDSGHYTETDIIKEKQELAQKGIELAKKVSNLETPNPRNIIPSLVTNIKGRLEMNTESQQEQHSRPEKVLIEISRKNLPSRPNIPSQGLLVSRISTDRWGTVTVPVPFQPRVGGRWQQTNR
jgi:hypothetical protein